MSRSSGYRQYFARLVDHEPFDLLRAALLIAAEDTTTLDLERTIEQVDAMGREVKDRIAGMSATEDQVRVLTRYLYDDCGLRGATSTYYDPRNSYLHEVLARKRGIPIGLAVITLTVAEQAGIALHGVGFPSHFLIGTPNGQFIDPFDPLEPKNESDCIELFERIGGSAKAFDRRMLAPVTTRQVVKRMLTNLKMIYTQLGDHKRANAADERILLLDPASKEAQSLRKRMPMLH